eukprot:CAMPEP_0183388086 /NCGR_PEP_ID=MMETSP0370-20130417/3796_1 /TAXON_ID=268820 /ORGANISM="Peridinium aciculiferum, Strain PAER-2" /LENGTH=79 /DNA_ID=CAMNT_0025566909 /DNA_START=335 /DNA_END=574 /DNA_ORIENTATION=-
MLRRRSAGHQELRVLVRLKVPTLLRQEFVTPPPCSAEVPCVRVCGDDVPEHAPTTLDASNLCLGKPLFGLLGKAFPAKV